MTEDLFRGDKSRSQAKREYRALKTLGVELVALSKGQLRAVPLSAETRDAVLAAKDMKRTALQRQYKYLASIIQHEDVEAIRAALDRQLEPHPGEVAILHEAEDWRDRLLSSEADHQAAFAERYPHVDRPRLRQLVRNARKERSLEKPPRSARLLLRYVRELAENDGAQPDAPQDA